MKEVKDEVKALDFDSEIEYDGPDYILLKPGNYDFVVASIDRKQYNGGSKIPPCPQAVIHIEITDPETGAKVPCQSNLFLASNQMWSLSTFFESIGLKKKGEKLKMDWSKVVGRTGTVEIDNREYNGNTYNNVKKYVAPKEEEKKNDWKW